MIERYGNEFINNEKKIINNPFKEEYYKLKNLDIFEEKELEKPINYKIQDNKDPYYKTYKGKNYTEEEWRIFEENNIRNI